jgi:hypothetical protein
MSVVVLVAPELSLQQAVNRVDLSLWADVNANWTILLSTVTLLQLLQLL